MESPLSPIIADLLLQDLEEKALNSIGLQLPIYYRYINDIIFAAPENKASHKDKTDFNANNNIVYKICCKDAMPLMLDRPRYLKTRLKEHVKNTLSIKTFAESINSTTNSIRIILRFWTLKLTIIKDSSQR